MSHPSSSLAFILGWAWGRSRVGMGEKQGGSGGEGGGGWGRSRAGLEGESRAGGNKSHLPTPRITKRALLPWFANAQEGWPGRASVPACVPIRIAAASARRQRGAERDTLEARLVGTLGPGRRSAARFSHSPGLPGEGTR